MNEQDFKHALRQTMTVQPAPPPMSDAVVLEAAHRDVKRRRAMMAGLGSAGAVAAVIVGVAVIAPAATGSGSGGVGVGAQVTSTPVSDAPPPASGTASVTEEGGKSSETLPPGMTGRTPKNGPEFDRGQQLATELDAVVPQGYGAPGDLKGEGELTDVILKHSQANLDDYKDGKQDWSYTAITPLTKGNGVGRLAVEVQTPREANTGAVCDLPPFWGEEGDCTEIMVGGKPVAVYNASGERFDQWATFRHDDGTVVHVGQAADYWNAGLPVLAGPPLTAEQLAALAADPRFNLDN
jgi:hypothetical protein